MNINPKGDERSLSQSDCSVGANRTCQVYKSCNETVVTFPFIPFGWWNLNKCFGLFWCHCTCDSFYLLMREQVVSSWLSVQIIELHGADEWVTTWFRRSEQLMWRQSMFILHNTFCYFFPCPWYHLSLSLSVSCNTLFPAPCLAW